jgi:hypothetical protein
VVEIIWDRGRILLHVDIVGLGRSITAPPAPLDNTYSVSFHTSQ